MAAESRHDAPRRAKAGADALLVAALAAGSTQQEAATKAGVSLRTVVRRLGDADFRLAVLQARGDLVDRAIGLLADAGTSAVGTLKGLLGAESEMARLGAAKAILELGAKLREQGEIEARLRAVEARDRGPS